MDWIGLDCIVRASLGGKLTSKGWPAVRSGGQVRLSESCCCFCFSCSSRAQRYRDKVTLSLAFHSIPFHLIGGGKVKAKRETGQRAFSLSLV